MKKLLVLVGSLFFILLVTVIAVPFFVDVDHYRPQIVEQANKNLNGKLELGKLKLSLWGSVSIHAESIRLTINGYPRPFLDTNRFHLEIPFSSILAFHPRVIAVLNAPKIEVEKNSKGEMNLMKLMKTTTAASEVIKPAPTATVVVKDTSTQLIASAYADAGETKTAPAVPAFLMGAALGLRMEKGDVTYVDRQTNSSYKLEGLDLDLRDLGLSSTMQLKFVAPVQGTSPGMKFNGVLSGAGAIRPIVVGGAVRSASGEIELDATKLALEANNGMVKKNASMPLTFKAVFAGTENDLLFKNIEFKFYDYKIFSKGLFVLVPSMNAKFEINADSIALDKLQDFVPMLSAYKLKGHINLMSTVESNGVNHKASGDIKFTNGEFFLQDMLKAPLHMSAQVSFTENSLNIIKSEVTGPGSDLSLQGSMHNFMAPQMNFSLTGKSLDLDKLIVQTEKKHATLSFLSDAYAAEGKKPDVNPMLGLAQNPMIAKASGNYSVQIGKVSGSGAVLENVIAKAQLQAMNLKLIAASFKAFGGNLNTNGEFDLKSPALGYKSSGKVNGMSAKEAFVSYFPKYQNTLDGKLDADWNVSGFLYPETVRMKSLKGTAKIVASDGTLRTVDFQDVIASSMSKIPFLKNAKPPKIDGGFKTLSANMAFKDGTINIEPFQMIGRGKGVDVKGKARISENMDHESFLDVYDSNGILPKEISHGSSAPAVAFHFTGLVTSPKTDYDYTVKKLASGSGKALAKSALQKALGGSNDGKSDDALKGIADKLKKKIKFF